MPQFTAAFNDARAFQSAALLESNKRVGVSSDGEIGTFSNSTGSRAIKWVKGVASPSTAHQRAERVSQTYERFLNAIEATQIGGGKDEMDRVRSALASDISRNKPLTSFRIGAALSVLSEQHPEHVLESRVEIKKATTEDYLRGEINRQASADPKLKNMKGVDTMLSERRMESLQRGVQEALRIQIDYQDHPVTKEQAQAEVARHVALVVKKLAAPFPDVAIRTVSSEGYSHTIKDDFNDLKSRLGWSPSAREFEKAAVHVGMDNLSGFDSVARKYSEVMGSQPSDGNFELAVFHLERMANAIDSTTDQYLSDDRIGLPETVKLKNVDDLEKIKEAIKSEKELLMACAGQNRVLDRNTGSVEWNTTASSLFALTESARFPMELAELNEEIHSYQEALNSKPVTQKDDKSPAKFSYDGAVSLDIALDRVEEKTRMLYEKAKGSPLVDADEKIGPLLDSIDKERKNITLLLQNPTIVSRSDGEVPLETIMAGKSWGDILTAVRSGMEYGPHMKPEGPAVPQETGMRPLGSGEINQVSQVDFQDGQTKVFKPENTTVKKAGGFDVAYLMGKYGLPTEQPRAIARNIATSNVAEAIGAGSIMSKSEHYEREDGTVGVLQDKAEGDALEKQLNKSLVIEDVALRDNPAFLRDLNTLQWVDALTMQADRHDENIILDYQQGDYKGIKGIDNDFSFGTKAVELKDIVAKREGPERHNPDTKTYGYNAGLPPLIDQSVYKQLTAKGAEEKLLLAVDGLLTSKELNLYQKRITEVINHAKYLGDAGRVVQDTGAGGAQMHPWELFRLPDPQNPGENLNVWQLSSDPGDSYYGRMANVP